VSQLRRYLGNRRKVRRAQTRLSFTLGLADPRTSSNGFRRLPTLDGHTLDVSKTGLGLVVPAIRIGGRYLAGNDHRLHLKLELPSGTVEMSVVPVRYESLEDHNSEQGYLIGAQIAEMNENDRAHFDEYVKNLFRHKLSKVT
jgi:hypothetical protein